MKYIEIEDDVWHDSDKEMPCKTNTRIEFMDSDGVLYKDGGIYCEFGNFYPYLKSAAGTNSYWQSFEVMVKWRFAK